MLGDACDTGILLSASSGQICCPPYQLLRNLQIIRNPNLPVEAQDPTPAENAAGEEGFLLGPDDFLEGLDDMIGSEKHPVKN